MNLKEVPLLIKKTYEEINAKIRAGEAVVVTAEEVISMVREQGVEETAAAVDVVTTGTFGPMCSSGAFFCLGHSKPRMKMSRVFLNGVEAYAGLAAVDAYLGATQIPETDPDNKNFPGEFNYGGGHVLEDLVAGKEVLLEATAYGTDCYPKKKLEKMVRLEDLPQATLYNPRNAYQNYNVAVNLSDRTLYTYMGILKPNMGNANYSTSGQLSPLFNDPLYRTIGMGTKIFLGGGVGYVSWQGTQHSPDALRGENGVPLTPAGTLAVIGDMKQMSSKWLRGVSFMGYGVSLMVGVGIPIPILDEEILKFTAVSDEEIFAPVVDYSESYPQGLGETIGQVSYAQLKSGEISVGDRLIPTAPLSSYRGARDIAILLKEWIQEGEFLLTRPVFTIPASSEKFNYKGAI
ncbi:MAG: homocysteine biosynthesis protein [Bacillota bacterium]|nr:homocysteine biosynthesis protein [Bacillota bacterium]